MQVAFYQVVQAISDREAREMTVGAAMNNSFGFGGHNCSVVFTKA